MEKKKSEFDKVFSAWDILVIAFGAMIGWGWVVSTGDWIGRGGVLGAVIGFAIGGIMVFFVGLTYAELTAAMPQCGGEHVFSYKAMGPVGSFICTWAIILGYVSVVCFEACALPANNCGVKLLASQLTTDATIRRIPTTPMITVKTVCKVAAVFAPLILINVIKNATIIATASHDA